MEKRAFAVLAKVYQAGRNVCIVGAAVDCLAGADLQRGRVSRTDGQVPSRNIRQPCLVEKHIDMRTQPLPQTVGQGLRPRSRCRTRASGAGEVDACRVPSA